MLLLVQIILITPQNIFFFRRTRSHVLHCFNLLFSFTLIQPCHPSTFSMSNKDASGCPPHIRSIIHSIALNHINTPLFFLHSIHAISCIHECCSFGRHHAQSYGMLPGTIVTVHAVYVPVPCPKPSWSASCLRQKRHIVLSRIIFHLSSEALSPKYRI